MERVLKSRVPLLVCAMLTSNLPIATLAQNAPSGSAGDAARRKEVAYLTPMVDLQRSRDSAQGTYQAMQFAAALPQYQTLCQSTASNAKDFYWLGQTYFHLNRFADAAQSFERAIAIDPRMDSVRVCLVQSYLGANQPQVAKEKCTAALNAVTDPTVRKDLTALEQYCQNRPLFRAGQNSQLHTGRRLVEK